MPVPWSLRMWPAGGGGSFLNYSKLLDVHRTSISQHAASTKSEKAKLKAAKAEWGPVPPSAPVLY